MTSPGAPYGVVGVPVQMGVSVFWTNMSIFPPFTAFCSAVYPWFWSQVSACECVRRVG